MSTKMRVLLCDDDLLYQQALSMALRHCCDVEAVVDGPQLLGRLNAETFDVVLLDLKLKNGQEGFALIREVAELDPSLPVVVHSGLDDYRSIVHAMALGADRFVPKACPTQVLESELLEAQKSVVTRCRPSVGKTPRFLGQGSAVVGLLEMVHRLRPLPGHVLISGEPGVGKSLLARQLRRAQTPWWHFDASACGEHEALELLFGGPQGKDRGLFARARSGVLLLDNIPSLSPVLQGRLNRALEDQEVRSGEAGMPSVRIIGTSQIDLRAEASVGRFRLDLLARLAVYTLAIPPLRSRPEDLRLYATTMYRAVAGTNALESCNEIMAALAGHHWPANVRELKNVIQYVFMMAGRAQPSSKHLPEMFHCRGRDMSGCDEAEVPREALASSTSALGLRERLRQAESNILHREYALAQGQVGPMSMKLKLNRTYLYEKLKAAGVIGRGRQGRPRA